MKKIMILLVVLFGAVLFNSSSFAKELSIGEMRSIEVDTQIIDVYFNGMDGRNCLVDIKVLEGGKEIFLEKIAFDWEREERNFSIGDKKILVFCVAKGMLMYVNDHEI